MGCLGIRPDVLGELGGFLDSFLLLLGGQAFVRCLDFGLGLSHKDSKLITRLLNYKMTMYSGVDVRYKRN